MFLRFSGFLPINKYIGASKLLLGVYGALCCTNILLRVYSLLGPSVPGINLNEWINEWFYFRFFYWTCCVFSLLVPSVRQHLKASETELNTYFRVFVYSHMWQILKKTQRHCADRQLPFPNIDFSKYESESPREVYVFEDEENPDAPIVVHFPLVNISFKEYKAPGKLKLFTHLHYFLLRKINREMLYCGTKLCGFIELFSSQRFVMGCKVNFPVGTGVRFVNEWINQVTKNP